MKKTILLVLMVALLATPCFAQEVETDGLFSIEGTTWRRIGVAISIGDPPFISLYDDTVSFTYQSGNIYHDFLVFSVASDHSLSFMILQPTIGVGVYSQLVWIEQQLYQPQAMNLPHMGTIPPLDFGLNFGFMFKVDDDNWTP